MKEKVRKILEKLKDLFMKLLERKLILGIVLGVIALIIIIIVIISLNSKGATGGLFGSSNKDVELKLKLSKNREQVSVYFDYPKNVGMVVQDTMWENEKTITNEDKNYTMELTLLDMDANYYNNEQESRKEETTYEEIILDKYNGYIYKYTDNIMEGCVLLNATDDICKYISIKLRTKENIINGEWTDVDPIYRLDEIQSVLNSFKYKSNGISEEDKRINDIEAEEYEYDYDYQEEYDIEENNNEDNNI